MGWSQPTATLCCLTALVMAPGLAQGEYKTPSDYLLTVGRDWVTPHIPWGKPYAHGRPRVLFLCPKIGAPREIVELAQRMNIDFDLVTTYNGQQLGVTETDAKSDPYHWYVPEMRLANKTTELQAKVGRDWDVIVLGHFRLAAIPSAIRQTILQKVSQGTGLVLVYDGGMPDDMRQKLDSMDGADPLRAGLPLATNPAFRACRTFQSPPTKDLADLVRLYRLGRGRVAVINYGLFHDLPWAAHGGHYSLTPWVPQYPFKEDDVRKGQLLSERYPPTDKTTRLHYEYALMLPARVILWATGTMAPRVHVLAAPEEIQLDQQALPTYVRYQVRADETVHAEVRCVLRHQSGEELHSTWLRCDIHAEPTEVAIPIPYLPVGSVFSEVIVTSAKGVEAWLATPLAIKGPATIKDVRLDRAKYRVGDLATVTITTSPQAAGLKISLSAEDGDRKKLVRTPAVVAKPPEQSLTFIMPATSSVSMMVRALLHSDDGRLVGLTDRAIAVDQAAARRAGYPVIMYTSDLGGYLQQLIDRQLRNLGVDAITNYPGSGCNADSNFNGLAIVPFPDWVKGYRYGCGNEDACNRQLEYFGQWARDRDQFSVLCYNFGDEINMAPQGLDSGLDNDWHQRFLSHLKKKYQNIQALNLAWGATFGDFNDIHPLSLAEARNPKNIASVLERWLFLRESWAAFFARAREKILTAVPGVIAGLEGSGSDDPTAWADYRTMGQVLDVWAPYQHNECDAVAGCLFRSFVPRHVLTGNWWGGYFSMRNPGLLRFLLWNQVVKGCNSMWFYTVNNAEGILGADFTPAYHYRLVAGDVERIRTVIGPLVAKSQWQPDPVAVYWSVPSLVGRELRGGRDIRWNALHGLFHALLHAGFDPRFVDHQSGLTPRVYRAVFLVDAQCLSKAECQKLGDYVRQGGYLIADVPPASCSELGVAYETPPLDPLFGIARDRKTLPLGMVFPQRGKVKLNTTFNGRQVRFARSEKESFCETMVVPAVRVVEGAAALGESDGNAPVFVVKNTGQGKTIFLNVTFDEYFGSRTPSPLGAECEVQRSVNWPTMGAKFIADMLASLGITPQVVIRDVNGEIVRNLRKALFSNGQDRVLVVACLPNQSVIKANVVLPRPYHVVDLRNGQYLGHTSRVDLTLSQGLGAAFSLLSTRN